MRIEVSEFVNAVSAVTFIEGCDLTPEAKVSVLQEIKNALPEGHIAGQYKETAVVVRSWLDERIAFNRSTSIKARQATEAPRKAGPKAEG